MLRRRPPFFSASSTEVAVERSRRLLPLRILHKSNTQYKVAQRAVCLKYVDNDVQIASKSRWRPAAVVRSKLRDIENKEH